MSYLKLTAAALSGVTVAESRGSPVRFGREADATVTLHGDAAKVVSARHAELRVEGAALIGYPAGSGFARDRASVVRTSMTAGILSRVTPDLIQFDGMTTGGSSGSPVFNADGELISVHRAGLRQGPGFALSVPVKYAIPLMPRALRQRLGV